MPDETTPSAEPAAAASVAATTEAIKVDDKLKQELQDAKGSVWQKVLIWGAAILAILGSIVGIVFLLKGKGPVEGVKEAVQTAKDESAKADLEEKIKLAEAKDAEGKVVEKLKEIKEIQDETKRLEELNKLL